MVLVQLFINLYLLHWHACRERILFIDISMRNQVFYLDNVYAPNDAKERRHVCDVLNDMHFDNPCSLFRDFNMVLEQKDGVDPSFIRGKQKPRWNALFDKWVLVNAWSLGPWSTNPSHTYYSLQYVGSSFRLDKA